MNSIQNFALTLNTNIELKVLPKTEPINSAGFGLKYKYFHLVMILCIAFTGLLIGLHSARHPWVTAKAFTPWFSHLFSLGIVLMTITVMELMWRLILACRYNPVPDCDDNLLPTCTVVVPAFNEGAQVYMTLKNLAGSDYPKEKLQLIAVDDGSQDNTWQWIKKAKQDLGAHLTVVRLHRNQGKRHALLTGFKKSKGEILITVDSDSMVEEKTLKHLVAPFVADSKVGGVAGNVRVLNLDKGIIPKLLDVIFVYSFDFVRASQSMVNTVLCTPGALSAYRRKVVMKVLQEWLHQTYFGRPAKIGEDRAMTNLILREGYRVLFQQNAKVYTEVPITYTKLCRMYLRWERSNIRETLAMGRFIFKRFRSDAMVGARINFLCGCLSVIKSPLTKLLGIGILSFNIAYSLSTLVAGILLFQSIAAVLYVWRYQNLNALWSYVYGFYFVLCLFWIKPYALVTSHKSDWLTRALVPKPLSLEKLYVPAKHIS